MTTIPSYNIYVWRHGLLDSVTPYSMFENAYQVFRAFKVGGTTGVDRVQLRRGVKCIKEKPRINQKLPPMPKPGDIKSGRNAEMPIAYGQIRRPAYAKG
jgi:hypothetical protein